MRALCLIRGDLEPIGETNDVATSLHAATGFTKGVVILFELLVDLHPRSGEGSGAGVGTGIRSVDVDWTDVETIEGAGVGILEAATVVHVLSQLD